MLEEVLLVSKEVEFIDVLLESVITAVLSVVVLRAVAPERRVSGPVVLVSGRLAICSDITNLSCSFRRWSSIGRAVGFLLSLDSLYTALYRPSHLGAKIGDPKMEVQFSIRRIETP